MRSKRKLTENIDVANRRRLRRKLVSSSSSSSSDDSDYVQPEKTSSSETISETSSQTLSETSSQTLSETSSRTRSENSSRTRSENSSENQSISDSFSRRDTKSIHSDFMNSKTIRRLKIDNRDLHSKFELVFNEIKNTEPNIMKIVSSNLQLGDKMQLFQLYEIYKKSYPHTHSWLDTRNMIINKIKEAVRTQTEYDRYSIEEHKRMERQSIELESKISDNMLQIKYKILNLETIESNKIVIYQKFIELQSLKSDDSEYSKLLNWIKSAIELPFDKIKLFPSASSMTTFLQYAYNRMEQELFGMKKVKEQLLFFINAKLTNPNMKRTNLGLVGPPGVGKTSIARLLSSILDIGFQQISCGGIDRADYFKGHDYTYVGSRSGEIVNCLKRMGTKNGILFFDEYEKVLENKSISALMLHVTDPSQNFEYRDNYFSELIIDLSHIWFIYSMNSLPTDEALKDRIFYIEIRGYKFNEKIAIVKDYILKKTLINSGLIDTDISLTNEAIKHLIHITCKNDRGVRSLEKIIMDIVNKLKFLQAHQDSNGKLPFDLSFKINKKITFPIVVDIEMLKNVIQVENTIDQVIDRLYI